MHKYIISISLVLCSLVVNAQEYVITNFGAKANCTKLYTNSIQKAINKASQNGGGTIVIPEGTFLSGALFFKPNTHLKLLKGAVLKGSDNIADYPLVPSRMEGKLLNYYAALVNAYNVDNFSISGEGTIDGNGLRFWKQFWAYRDSLKSIGQVATNLDVHRPRLIFIRDSKNIKILNTKLCNSGFWTTHLYKCRDILIENCRITSPKKPVPAPSTDGIDLDVCSNVLVRGCYISVNDDAICIKGGKGPLAHTRPENGIVENVLIENCTVEYPAPGILTLGSECIHGRNIKVLNCKVINCAEILLLKMRRDTYHNYEDITIDGVTGTCKYVINMDSWKQFTSLEGTNEKPFGVVQNITLSNIKAKCTQLGNIQGNPSDTVSNIVFRNVDITAVVSGIKSKHRDMKFENVMINGASFDNK